MPHKHLDESAVPATPFEEVEADTFDMKTGPGGSMEVLQAAQCSKKSASRLSCQFEFRRIFLRKGIENLYALKYADC